VIFVIDLIFVTKSSKSQFRHFFDNISKKSYLCACSFKFGKKRVEETFQALFTLTQHNKTKALNVITD